MATLQRRALENARNENVMASKSTKTTVTGNRRALANISNIQKRPALGGKKKDPSQPDKVTVTRGITRSKSSSKLQSHVSDKKDVFIFHDEIKEEKHVVEVEDPVTKLAEQIADFDVEDIDADDFHNPTLCAEYVKDIYKYLHKLEKKLQPSDYMSKQTSINKKMRCILVDWLIQVQSRFNLLQETLYLSIYTMDRFLDKVDVSRSDLQLVGVTAMLIASKYEEMYAPEVGDFAYITDNAYSKIKIRAMEQKMLKACEFDFSNPLCLHFLRRNSKAGSVDAQKHTLAKYLMEMTLIDYEMSILLPSQIAAAALYLSIHLIDKQLAEWTQTLAHYSGYSEKEILPTVHRMSKLILTLDNSKYQAVKNKYSASKFMRISRLPDLTGSIVQEFASEVQED